MIRIILSWGQTQVHLTLTSVIDRLFCFVWLFVCYSFLTPSYITGLHQNSILPLPVLYLPVAASRMSQI